MWRFLRNRDFPTNCGLDSVIGRKMSRGASREFGGFPTKQVARGRFVGKSWLFCAENSGILRQIRSRGDVLSEYEPVCSLEVRCFSDKTGRTGTFCRNMSRYVRWEFAVFPTKQVVRGRFVGIGGRFCAESTRFFRQNRSRGSVLSERAGCFVLGALGFSDKTGRDEVFCRNTQSVLC